MNPTEQPVPPETAAEITTEIPVIPAGLAHLSAEAIQNMEFTEEEFRLAQAVAAGHAPDPRQVAAAEALAAAAPGTPSPPSGPGEGGEREQPVPAYEDGLEERAVTPLPPWPVRAQELLAAGVAKLPRPWSQPQPTLKDMVAHSQAGDWTTQPAGKTGRRALHLVFTAVITVPIAAACDGVKWAVLRPGRLLTTVLVLISALTLLNAVNDEAVADVLTWPGLAELISPF